MPSRPLRSPQLIASFSNWALGRVPVRAGRRGSLTSYTLTESRADITNSGAERRKQPEMPAEPGFEESSETLLLATSGTRRPPASPA